MVVVTNKVRMYRLLDRGDFGNTTQRWYSLSDWEKRTDEGTGLWGLRNARSANNERMRLDVPTAEVPSLYRSWYGESGGQISPMVDHMLVARLQLIEDPVLRLWWVQGNKEVKWREAFRTLSNNCEGLVAWAILRHYLNADSVEDLRLVLDRFPLHAVELTALDRCFGTVPNRNAIVWEVRAY